MIQSFLSERSAHPIAPSDKTVPNTVPPSRGYTAGAPINDQVGVKLSNLRHRSRSSISPGQSVLASFGSGTLLISALNDAKETRHASELFIGAVRQLIEERAAEPDVVAFLQN